MSGVVRFSNKNNEFLIKDQGVTEDLFEISEDLEGFIKKVKQQPKYTHAYHAYMFSELNMSVDVVKKMVEMAKKFNFPLRVWKNDMSGTYLFVFADTDLSENTGFPLYEQMQKDEIQYDSYGMPSIYEWNTYGIEIDTSLEIDIRSDNGVIIGDVAITWR